jgi:hypothetical protein
MDDAMDNFLSNPQVWVMFPLPSLHQTPHAAAQSFRRCESEMLNSSKLRPDYEYVGASALPLTPSHQTPHPLTPMKSRRTSSGSWRQPTGPSIRLDLTESGFTSRPATSQINSFGMTLTGGRTNSVDRPRTGLGFRLKPLKWFLRPSARTMSDSASRCGTLVFFFFFFFGLGEIPRSRLSANRQASRRWRWGSWSQRGRLPRVPLERFLGRRFT